MGFESELLTTRVPASVDLDILFSTETDKRKRRILKEGAIYIISKLTVSEQKEEVDEEFVNLHSSILENIVGKGKEGNRVTSILQELLSHNIIEKNINKKYRVGYYSQSFRLKDEHRYSNTFNITLSQRISDAIINFSNHTTSKRSTLRALRSQFEKHNLSVDLVNLKIQLNDIGNRLLSKNEISNNPKSCKEVNRIVISNYIGKIYKNALLINDKDFYATYSYNNHRLNTNITGLNKVIRPYLRINDQYLAEADISNSQPLILAAILSSETFQVSKRKGHFTLFHIYKHLYDEIENGNVKNNKKYLRELGIDLKWKDFIDLKSFKDFDFSYDFYNYLLKDCEIDLYNSIMHNASKSDENPRAYIKRTFMQELFWDDSLSKQFIDVHKLVKSKFNGLSEFLELFLSKYGKTDFAYLLQRTESFLVIEKTIPVILKKNPDIPLFTIHDSILTTPRYIDFVQNTLKETISMWLNRPFTSTIKIYDSPMQITDAFIDRKYKRMSVKVSKEIKSIEGRLNPYLTEIGNSILK